MASTRAASSVGRNSVSSTASLMETIREQFGLHRPYSQPFYILLCSFVLLLLAGAIRSAVVLSEVYVNKVIPSQKASDSLSMLLTLEEGIEVIFQEGHARVPFIVSRDPPLKAELNQRQADVDSVSKLSILFSINTF